MAWWAAAGCAEDPSFDDPPFHPPSVNRPPSLGQVTATTEQNVPVAVDLLATASDPDGDRLVVTSAYNLLSGLGDRVVLRGDQRTVDVTPTFGFAIPISVYYLVEDGHGHAVSGTAEITVTQPDRAPIATSDQLAAVAGLPRSFSLHASDQDGQALTFTVVTQPAHGTISGSVPDLVYTPTAGFSGIDQLTFSVSDGKLTSEVAYVVFVVARDNHAPVAAAATVTMFEDTTKSITLAGSDPDGDALKFDVKTPPAHGALFGVAPDLTYLPSSNYSGPDSFSFVARDPQGAVSAPAAVAINVTGVNDAPAGIEQQRNVNEDQSLAITLTANDPDGDVLSFAIATEPAHGTLTGTPPNLTYLPAADYNGPDGFTFTVSDGTAASAATAITLSVAPVNDAPVAVNGTVTTDEDTAVAIDLQASDIDGQPLTYSIVAFPSDGVLSVNGSASLTYTPAANANGTRTFTFQASDGAKTSAPATVTITITPANDPPTATDDYVATDAGQALTVDLTSNDSDLDGDAVTISAPGTPAHGTAVLVGGKWRYTPVAGFTGVDVFTYTIADPTGATATATVHVGVGAFPTGAPLETVLALAVATDDERNAPSLSSDGRFVAFATTLGLVSGDTNGATDIYLYDRGDRTVTWISQSSAGAPGNAASRKPQISADGRFVAFESIASTLVAGDSNATIDVFRHDRITGETVRVSVATGGGQATGTSIDPRISDDGNRVAFTSTAFDLVANDANGATDIFVRDLVAGTTTRVSVGTTGGEGDLGAVEPAISGDGRFVAFTSAATNLTPGDTNHVSDVFVRDLAGATTTRVSVSSTGGEANSSSLRAALSQDGRFISFLSSATNLVTGGSGFGTQVYVRDGQAQTTTRPVASPSVQRARLSGDGRYLAIQDGSGVQICDRFAANTVTPPGASAWRWPSWSRDGRYLAVITAPSNGTLVIAPNPL
ncbi:MAG: Ig-like domain-containing protein [Kofleriaceae bacterium]